MSRKQRAGKDFERLIARLEELLAPAGAIVKTPDYIADLVTGRKREVDASIRFPGDHKTLITVECRDYKRVRQDDRWLEQLITKREKIGASTTIAVSSTGFSDSAVKTGKHYGIELRQLTQITDADIVEHWLGDIRMSFIYPSFVFVNMIVRDKQNTELSIRGLPDSTAKEFDEKPTVTKLFSVGGDTELLSPADFFNFYFYRQPASEWLDREGDYPFVIHLRFGDDKYGIVTSSGVRPISELLIKYSVCTERTNSSPKILRRYSSMTDTLMDQIDSTADLGDIQVDAKFYGRIGKPLPEKK